MTLTTIYGALLLAGSVAIALAAVSYVRDSWRSRGSAGERLAHTLSSRAGAGGASVVTSPPPAPHATAVRGFEFSIIFGCWGLAFVTDLAVQALLAQVDSVSGTGGRALFAALAATAVQLLLGRRARADLESERREGSAYAIALGLGLLAGAVAAGF